MSRSMTDAWGFVKVRDTGESFGLDDIGLGYTIATGKLYCDFPRLQEFVEELLCRPVMTHEFADKDLWVTIRTALEERIEWAENG